MNPALGISRSGMQAYQNAMDTISYDIANVNTTAYKGRQSEFEALLTNQTVTTNDLLVEISSGSRNEVSTLNMQQGSLVASEGDYQLAIKEDGFFQVTAADGNTYYTRDGNFHIDQNNVVVNARGEALTVSANGNPIDTPVYQIPADQLIAVGENKYALANGATAVLDTDATVLQGYLENSNVDLATRFTDMMVVQRAYAMNIKAAQSTDELMGMINQFKQ